MAKKKKAAKRKGAKKVASGDMIVSKSRTKAAANINVSGDFYGALNDAVHSMIKSAEQRAINNGRKTLRPHDLYKASGHDLYLEVPVTPWEAALGASVEVPTPEGKVSLKIPAGSKAGQKLRVRGRGLPRPKSGEPGDLYAVLQIVTPTVLSEAEKELYRRLAQASSFNPRAHFE